MILPVYIYGTRVLRRKAKPVARVDDGLIRLIMDMFDTMHNDNGIGLAANQVGRLKRVIVVDISDVEESDGIKIDEAGRKPLALINPEILSEEGTWTMEEGCLSIPDVRDAVERAERITVRFKDTSFRDVTLDATGLLARVILHEVDHLNGVLFLDHLSDERLKVHEDRLKQLQRGEFEYPFPVVTATPSDGVKA